MGAEHHHLQPVVARLERARDGRRDADRVHRTDRDHLIVELHTPLPGEDHVDLLGLLVAMGERLPPARLDAEEREPDRLGVERLAREPRLLHFFEAELGGDVVDFAEILDRVAHDRSLPASSVISRRRRASAGVSAPERSCQRQFPLAREG